MSMMRLVFAFPILVSHPVQISRLTNNAKGDHLEIHVHNKIIHVHRKKQTQLIFSEIFRSLVIMVFT